MLRWESLWESSEISPLCCLAKPTLFWRHDCNSTCTCVSSFTLGDYSDTQPIQYSSTGTPLNIRFHSNKSIAGVCWRLWDIMPPSLTSIGLCSKPVGARDIPFEMAVGTICTVRLPCFSSRAWLESIVAGYRSIGFPGKTGVGKWPAVCCTSSSLSYVLFSSFWLLISLQDGSTQVETQVDLVYAKATVE